MHRRVGAATTVAPTLHCVTLRGNAADVHLDRGER
jgi:hypothetical protein